MLKKSNQNRVFKRLARFREKFKLGTITKEKILLSMAGWNGYVLIRNTYGLRQKAWRKAAEIIHHS